MLDGYLVIKDSTLFQNKSMAEASLLTFTKVVNIRLYKMTTHVRSYIIYFN